MELIEKGDTLRLQRPRGTGIASGFGFAAQQVEGERFGLLIVIRPRELQALLPQSPDRLEIAAH